MDLFPWYNLCNNVLDVRNGADAATPFDWLAFSALFSAEYAPRGFVWWEGFYGRMRSLELPYREQKHLKKCLLGDDIYLKWRLGSFTCKSDYSDRCPSLSVDYTATIWKYPRRGAGTNYLLEVNTPVGVYREGFDTTDLWVGAAARKGTLLFEYVCRVVLDTYPHWEFMTDTFLTGIVEGDTQPVMFPELAWLLDPNDERHHAMFEKVKKQ